ncbi:ribonuclease H-like domain-containing protein, partial [Lentinula edodes]
IGFDLEWKPNYRPGEAENPIAVIQIAFQTASYVVHVRWMRNLPDGLAEILENPRIVKVGVGIQNDAKKLFKDLRICLNSCVDLSLFVKCVDSGLFAERPYSSSIGLARLAETYEGIVLTKGKITRSNWDLELSPAQLTYAALDAYAGSVVYTHLIRLFSLLE